MRWYFPLRGEAEQGRRQDRRKYPRFVLAVFEIHGVWLGFGLDRFGPEVRPTIASARLGYEGAPRWPASSGSAT
jgi:hypothetical protein